ncbi:MAG TPA: hypothetical protein VFD10_05130, partial [Atribacterota bacterium]|nr:hypothetical protein [Atribacterota bacterium]
IYFFLVSNLKLIILSIKTNKVQDNLLCPALIETFLIIFSSYLTLIYIFFYSPAKYHIKYAIAPMIAAHQYQAKSAILLHLPLFYNILLV